MEKWREFFFEGNLAWGRITCAEDWDKIKTAYKESGINLLDCKCTVHYSTIPSFGLYCEYKGKTTLKDFAKQNGMTLDQQ